VSRLLDDVGPQVLINCAAWTAVDAAEADPDGAFRVNALGPRVLAAACAARAVLLVHVSTDYVFDGTAATPIDEWQKPHPRSVYGASKLAGEREVRALSPLHQVVRTSWLYGAEGPNFVRTMLRAGAQRSSLRVVSDQVGSPTWTGHLAPALLRLAQRGLPGTYHLTNSGKTSWHGFAEEIFALAGMPVEVVPISTAEYPTPALRPAYSVLENRAWRLLGEEPLPDWRDGLRGYVEELRAAGAIGPGRERSPGDDSR
jgi:dTDP-4-dehydrorhamnose reductase